MIKIEIFKPIIGAIFLVMVFLTRMGQSYGKYIMVILVLSFFRVTLFLIFCFISVFNMAGHNSLCMIKLRGAGKTLAGMNRASLPLLVILVLKKPDKLGIF